LPASTYRFNFVAFFFFSVIFLLQGCASLAPPPASSQIESQQRSGRFSITAYALDIETVIERQSGGFSAEIAPTAARVDLISPLGQILARVSATQQSADLRTATIETADGKRFDATSALADEEVTQKVLGLPLPLLGLSNSLVQTTAIPVEGWEIDIQETMTSSTRQGPRRLKMTWMRHNQVSKHSNTQLNPEIGRIVVLVIINE
jgi:outer membrane biogenesis lipoprotein LolB